MTRVTRQLDQVRVCVFFTCIGVVYVCLVAYALLFVKLEDVFQLPHSQGGLAPTRLPPWYAPGHVAVRQAASLWKTDEIARDIELHQSPSDCAARRYMRLRHSPSGLGSLVHIATAHLALAWERGDILVYGDNFASGWTDGAYCAGHHSLECFFQPLSRCAPGGQPPPGADVYDVHDGEDVVNKIPLQWHDAFQKDAAVRKALPGADQDVGVKYWWRAQAASYVLRLNARTASYLREQRVLLADQMAVPLPLPPDTFSCHVRHSDKGREMQLFDFSTYAQAVARVADANRVREPYVFVSTEDPRVVDDARATFGARALVVPYARTNPRTLNAHMAAGANETLHSLLNLWIAVECKHFVGQLGSNWNRLVDELRRVWVGGAHMGCCTRYVEVGCGQPVCAVETTNW